MGGAIMTEAKVGQRKVNKIKVLRAVTTIVAGAIMLKAAIRGAEK